MLNKIKKNWFFVGILIVVLIGLNSPAIGIAVKPYTKLLIFLAMFIMGLRQKFVSFVNSIKNYWTISFVLFNCFVIMPLLGFILGKLFFSNDLVMFTGIMIASSVSTTLVSAIVWTNVTKGNESLSLVLVVFSSLLSIFLTPLILFLSLNAVVAIPVLEIFIDLFFVILSPVIFAQLFRHFIKLDYNKFSNFSKILGNIIILLWILISISTAEGLNLKIVSYTLIAVAVHYSLVSIYSYKTARLFNDKKDSISAMYCSSQKTITTSVLISLTYFQPLASIYIIIYHIFQQVMGLVSVKLLTKN